MPRGEWHVGGEGKGNEEELEHAKKMLEDLKTGLGEGHERLERMGIADAMPRVAIPVWCN